MTETPYTGNRPPRPVGDAFRDLSALRRSTDHRLVAGVASGVSRHFDVDPVVVRVAFAALTLFSGAGVALYAVLWLTVPKRGWTDSIVSHHTGDPERVQNAGLVIGGLLGALLALGSVGWYTPHPFPGFLLVVIAIAGLLIVWRRSDSQPKGAGPDGGGPDSDGPGSGGPPPAGPPPAPAPDTAVDPYPSGRPLAVYDVPPAPSPVQEDSPSPDIADDPPRWAPPGPPEPPSWSGDTEPGQPRPQRRRSHLLGITCGLIVIAWGVIWAVDAAAGEQVPWSLYPGVALGLITLALLAGTWWGRSRTLIPMGVLAALCTLAAVVLGSGPYGTPAYTPDRASQVQDRYALAAGQLTLHLEDVADPQALDGRTITLYNRVGQVRVILPSSINATVNARVDVGEVSGLRDHEPYGHGGMRATLTPGTTAPPQVQIDIRLLAGQVTVDRVRCPGDPLPAPGGADAFIIPGGSNAAACH